MGLREEIKNWRQPNGLIVPKREKISPPPDDSTGNGLLYTSLYYIQLVKNGLARPQDLDDFEKIILSCKRKGPRYLLNRSPTKYEEQTAHDDYVGVCVASMYLRSNLAWNIVDTGNRRWFYRLKWLYKNVAPWEVSIFDKETLRAWLGRMPWNIAAMQWAAGITPHYLRIILLALSILFTKLNGSSAIQTWLRIKAANGRSALVNWAAEIFFLRATNLRMWVADELELDHPIIKYWRD